MEFDKDTCEAFSHSFESSNSNIQILDGSFSKLKPMLSSGDKKSCREIFDGVVPEPTTSGFIPVVTSTPRYEDISEEENVSIKEEPEEESIDRADMSVDFQMEINAERESCELYINEVVNFITKTQDMVKTKLAKRRNLVKKLKKCQKKAKLLEHTIKDLDRFISFGEKLPTLLNTF